ncbi:phospholipase A-2-activating protein-like [Saccoglossus kowalevskii]|uniref:Phospholipase A-2-activating protein-like n=1 Tax=Saccoglossus kowalevskii TaxID=10224 RepID=A0ABM0GYG4_SACKO|nr:PREDICTED: phospholipase A-2-activating protein-like [Saccoglossus kowalevskii]
MATSSYKLSCTLIGHEGDVRAVTTAYSPEGAIISGSRDKTARIWVPISDGRGFMQAYCLTGHKNFISCVCIMPPSEAYSQGLIMTGSNDNTINAYLPTSTTPLYTLSGHTNTVCALAAGKFGTLLSGSWDCTAKVWLQEKNVMTLKGHSLAVWAVAVLPSQGLMLSASADKTIKLWRTGKCEQTFTGHTDCVRALAVLSDVEFLSASNDASIRRWLTSGQCLQEYYGHTNYVYSLSVLPNGTDFATVGEDRTLRIWKAGDCAQTVHLPAQSVWSVTTLNNGDIAVGASDNMVRVFTCNPDRTASAEEIDMFEKQVSSASLNPESDDLGKIKIDELPGPESLHKPGKKDGQTTMVRVGENKVEAYSWSAADMKWNKIGDVVGSADSSQRQSGKATYEGKEYDYVFSVDIEEGKPPLQLPYNISEDPWFAAQRFLNKHELSPLFLDQVANFIVENSKGVTLGGGTPVTVSDPFTGGSRYIPAGSNSTQPSSGPTPMQDPFTGGSRYVPGSGQQPMPSSLSDIPMHDPLTGGSRYIPTYGQPTVQFQSKGKPLISNAYFPKTSYLTFDSINGKAVIDKLKELNTGLCESDRLDDNQIQDVSQLLDVTQTPSMKQIEILWKLLQWPADTVFPALDILRISIQHQVVNQHFCNEKDGQQFLGHLHSILSHDTKPANQMLVLRTLCNAFSQAQGNQCLLSNRDGILTSFLEYKDSNNRNVRISLSSLILNYCVALASSSDVEGKAQCLSVLAALFQCESESEAQFRYLVGLGTLIANNEEAIAISRSLDLLPVVTKATTLAAPAKVSDCAKLVENILK